MMKKKTILSAALAMMLAIMVVSARAEIVAYERDVDYSGYIKYDRFLDIEIWTDNDEYYEDEDISISFRANQDCFVAIYNIDTRGHVSLIYPADEWDESMIEGGRIYRIPDRYDDYDLTIQGPAGVEYLQMVASRKPLAIPEWYDGSGLVCDDDPYDFMEFVNATYFGCNHDCPRAFDLTSFRIKEWHNYYFRPVHVYHHYPYWDWGFCGSVYIDYPFGATIYIDGVYWGIAPLFIPRVYYGWHYLTIYDRYGYCWEERVQVYRRKSIVIDETVVRTKTGVRSRFKEVRRKGYLDPIKNGYPGYDKEVRLKKTFKPVASKSIAGSRYKVAEEKSTRAAYNGKYKSKSSGQTSAKRRSPTYGTQKKSGKTSAAYKYTKPEKRTYKKSSIRSKPTKSYGSKKSTKSSTESSKSYREKKSTPSKSSGDSKKSTSASKKSGSVKKSPSKGTSSKSTEGKSSSSSAGKSGKRRR